MSPDVLGNPQHFVAGAVLAFLVAHVAGRWVRDWWARVAIAVGVTLTAEIFVEIAEYFVWHQGTAEGKEYYDLVADLVASLVGALTGAAGSLVLTARRS